MQLALKNQVGKVWVGTPALHHDDAIHKMQRQTDVGTAMIQLMHLCWRWINLSDHAAHCKHRTQNQKNKNESAG